MHSNSYAMALPIPTTSGSIEAYIQAANRFPILSAEEEGRYARRYLVYLSIFL